MRCAYRGLSDALTSEPFALFFEPPTVALDDCLAERPTLWFKTVIPAAVKWEIRDEFDQSNITERVLFPGLDGLTTWL